MNTELIEVLQNIIAVIEKLNQLAVVDFNENEKRIVDQARVLVNNVTEK